MTNTKFRKRALLSSVAMLLVALVALGSATFAWFAESPNVDAQGLIIKTTASDGLEIMADIQNSWGTTAILNYTNRAKAFNLTPASQVQNVDTTYHGDTFFTVKAAAPGDYSSGNNLIGPATAGNSGNVQVYKEDLFFRLTQTSAASASRNVVLTGVTIAVDDDNDSTLYRAIRVSICDANNKILGTYALSGYDEHGTIPYGSSGKKIAATAAEGAVVPVEFSPSIATSVSEPVAMVNGVSKASAKTGDDVKKVTVYVWLDGQDTACNTNNVDQCDVSAIISSIDLDFTLAAKQG